MLLLYSDAEYGVVQRCDLQRGNVHQFLLFLGVLRDRKSNPVMCLRQM